MYSLKTPNASQLTDLSRAMSSFLEINKVDMLDRRIVTAFTLAKIVGGSLPVLDVVGTTVKANTFRDQLLPEVKAYIGRIAEGIVIDTDLAVIGSYYEWARRCSVAYPAEPCLGAPAIDYGQFSGLEQTAALKQVEEKYPNLELPYTLRECLVQRGA